MSVPPKPRVLFVEDESSISGPFSKALAREGFEPVVAATAARALELADQIEPDIVLLDLTLPDGDGRDVCRALRRRSNVPILMLTARGTETDRIVGLEIGADDYVVKPFSGAEVIARIRAVLRRSAARAREAAGAGGARRRSASSTVDPGSRRARLAGEELQLSRKEFDLLVELIGHAGRVVTREDLMARVWDENWFGSTKTLDVHVRWLRQKLGDVARRAALPAHGARRRLPLHRAGGVRGMTLRGRLLLALAYILLLAIVALEVPLAISLRDRVDAEVRSQARCAGRRRRRDRRGQPRRARGRSTTRSRPRPGPSAAASSSTDPQGALLADSAGTDRLGTDYGDRPEIAQALRAASRSRTAAAATRSTRRSSPPPCRWSSGARASAPCG